MTLDIPNYRVIERIGSGAGTAVYRGRCMRSGSDYAIKTAKVRSPEDMKIIDLMRDEHAVGSRVDHPVVRKVYEFRLIRQRLRTRGALLFMEFAPGIPMSDKNFKASLDEVLSLFVRVAEGLAAMHRAGFVHADMKPGNIIVTPDGEAKLIDLGQSCKMSEVKPRIQGTIDYMAPEQAQRSMIDRAPNVFGLGATLHRVLTGKPVPTEMNQTVNPHSHRLLGKRVDEAPQPVLTELPIAVAKLIEDCCRSLPEERPSDISKVQQRLALAHAVLTKPQFDHDLDLGDDDDHLLDEAPADHFSDEEHSFMKNQVQDES